MNNFSIGIDLGGTRIKTGSLKDNVLLEKNLDAESDYKNGFAKRLMKVNGEPQLV